MSRAGLTYLALALVGVWMIAQVEGLGCPCLGGIPFSPAGTSTLVVPSGKRIEEEFQRFLSSWIGQSLRGAFARAVYNQPRDLRDYAYENSRVMFDTGKVQYPMYPVGCVGCDYKHYQQARATSIQTLQDIDFSSSGYPLQSVTGGRGWCVLSVDEFYGYSPYYSPTVLLEDVLSRTTAEGNTAIFGTAGSELPLGPTVPEPGPHFYGIGVYTQTEQGGGPFYVTIIRVILIQQPDCTCGSSSCIAGTFSG